MQQDDTLEESGTDTPDLDKIAQELNQANTDSAWYRDRMANTRAWWLCEWPGQSTDGRRWANILDCTKDKVFPWDGCSDSRLRVVSTIVQDHVTIGLVAFWSSKKQARSIRPFISGREVNVTQNMLDWRIGTQMKRELLREVPYVLNWRFGGGLCFTKVEWEQQRELVYVPISLDMIARISSQLGLGDVTEKILDPDKTYDRELITVLQSFSPVLPTSEARTILSDLRNTGQSELPTASLRVNKPKWSGKRPLIDVLFPSETWDIQQTRFTAEREVVSESELTDRIVTDGYDPDFVDVALMHKGQSSSWWSQAIPVNYLGSNRDMVELTHTLSWRLDMGVPCLYRTVFNESTMGGGKKSRNLYAVHRKFEYDHGQIPFIAHRRGSMFKPLLHSMGIAEESYTDEIDIKRQQDGLNDRTEIIHQPPMILPTLRAQAMGESYGPRARMTSMRPEGVVFPPLPPMDQTPVIVMQMVQDRLDRRYAIIGGNVDPEIKAARRTQLANDILGEYELVGEQTLQLMQQFETDEDVQRVAGGDQWNYSKKDIQGQYEISFTCDINLIDNEVASMKLDMLAKLGQFREQGKVYNAAANIVSPDLADMLSEDQASPAAMQKEQDAEYAAVGQIMTGIEPPKPIMAMNNVRLQVIQQIMSQPQVAQQVMQNPVTKKLLENRVKFFMDQIQQTQLNPQIGRTLATQTFQPNQPAPTTQAQLQ